MSITWNKRLIKTAGFCAYNKRVATPSDRNVRIELSVKVCDTAERVRDTLIHELCHAAVWFLNGVNDGHGSLWKYWAHAACRAHPELPPIKRCHKYKITHKFTYKCTKCGYEIGRHSKSLDTKAKVCGYCRSPFVLVTRGTATPRTPNKFALFVKDNYGSVKRDNKAVTHQDVMRILSSDFARQNSISSSG
ncbi:hypothetical protein NP493_258g01034 [Ridgeia piscesae]|uniref:SprT-like domain-containing protein n=1 Tax=Ridgeia piscesae TaxID=27915 RepID=A0AAD9UCS7_RIDPI|nr:hypothetical protein NP493_258g01034 [Ridgeia piscesae]